MLECAEPVDRPNIRYQEIGFEFGNYIVHKWCEKWHTPSQKKQHRRPLLVRINTGPIHCELCGRRTSRLLKKMVENNSIVYRCRELINQDREVTLRFYTLRRPDLRREGLEGWQLNTRLSEELL